MTKAEYNKYHREYMRRYRKTAKWKKKRAEYNSARVGSGRGAEAVSRYQTTPKGRYALLRGKCKYHKLDLDLPFDVFCDLIRKPCHYCKGKVTTTKGCGLDRLDSSKGYITTNVVPCCFECNRVKSNIYTPEQTAAIMMFIQKLLF